MKQAKPDPILEFRLLGEIPNALRKRAQASCAEDSLDALDALRESDRRILEETPPAAMAESIQHRLREEDVRARARRNRFAAPLRWSLYPALALGGVLIVLLPFRQKDVTTTVRQNPTESAAVASSFGAAPARAEVSAPGVSPTRAEAPRAEERIALAPVEDDGIRTKGSVPRLRLHRVEEPSRSATALRDGDTVAPGSVLQATLLAGPSKWAAVLSVDAAGQVTRHLPEQGDSSLLVEGALQAPHSFQLDAAPGFERFVLVESDRPFALKEAEAALRRAGRSGVVANHPWMSCQSLLVVKPETKP